jgi:ferric-dicitrate binding protein FerR (iron transport regulator)
MEQEMEKIIVRNLSGEASCEDIVALSEWIASKEENKITFARIKKYWDAEVTEACPGNREAARRALFARIRTSGRRPFDFGRWLRYAAVAAVAAVFAGLAVYRGMQHPGMPETVYCHSFVTGNSTSTFQLPDETKISLNRNSTLTYSSLYGAQVREVTLQGEAFFEVVKNQEKAFIVNLGENRITVLGTTFNVKHRPEENMLTATLIEGAIRFESSGQTVLLKPNQQLAYSLSDDKISVSAIESEVATAWKDHLLRYKSVSFAEFLALLEKQYGVEILLSDKNGLGMQKVSGAFDTHLSVEQILNLTKKNLSFNWKKKENRYVIMK